MGLYAATASVCVAAELVCVVLVDEFVVLLCMIRVLLLLLWVCRVLYYCKIVCAYKNLYNRSVCNSILVRATSSNLSSRLLEVA